MDKRDREEQKLIIAPDLDEGDKHDQNIEDFFGEEYEEHEEEQQRTTLFQKKGIKRLIAITLSIMLFANILAFWPQVYSLAAIQFLFKSRELSKDEEVQRYRQAVVVVKAENRKGTGVNIAEHGFIITNQHVVGGANEVIVNFPDGKSYLAKVINSDATMDIALLELDQANLPTLKLSAESEVDKETPVYVIGNPLYFDNVVNEGVVAGMLTDRVPPAMMIEAPVYKGNSGSPVITRDGEVIAIIFATTQINEQGNAKEVGLAVPVDQILETFQFSSDDLPQTPVD